MDRRSFLTVPTALTVSGAVSAVGPAAAEVRVANGKPTLFVRGQPVYACFYALTDCLGGRWTWDELPRLSIAQFVQAGFRLFQVDLFLQDVWLKEGPLDLTLARRQIRGVLDLCPEGAVVIRWHVNAPKWWAEANPEELTQYANGPLERPERDGHVRIIMDDLLRTPRVSLASKKWRDLATTKTIELLKGLAATPEGEALAGIHVACGVYGEWHYWGFMRNEPDVSAPMQSHFRSWRASRGREAAPVPGVAERTALDDGIFRDPSRRTTVIDYYRSQQELVADLVVHFCRTVKRNWPRPIVTGTFYGYFFSMFDRQVTGGHLCLRQILESPDVDYLSAPQAYGTLYRDVGGCGITRGLVESARLNGKLLLDEMDQTPSWKWQNNVDTAFVLTDVPADIAIIRRNVMESFARGMGLWYYDFGPANNSGWWADRRLMAEITRLKEILERYHRRPYQPAADVLFVYDTEVFYFTGSMPGTDPVTDPLAVNRAVAAAWQTSASIETIHLGDLPKADLGRFRMIVFANTWLLTAEQRAYIRTRVMDGKRHVLFAGPVGYCDGERLGVEMVRDVTGLDVVRHPKGDAPAGVPRFEPLLSVQGEPARLVRRDTTWFAMAPLVEIAQWRQVLGQAGAHFYSDANDVVHAGAGLVLLHTKEGGRRRFRLRSGREMGLELPEKASWLFDAETGERLL